MFYTLYDDVVRREVIFCGLGCKTIYDLNNSFALKDNSKCIVVHITCCIILLIPLMHKSMQLNIPLLFRTKFTT